VPAVELQRLTVAHPRTDLRLPNLLIAGVTHANASALARGLARHPEICPSATRRIDHFTPLRYGYDVRAPLEDYDDHFASWTRERYRLENSPVYFDGGRRLVHAVRSDLPDVRVVLVLRDPAQRLWTSFVDKVTSGRLPAAMTFDTFVERCLALRANGTDRYEGNRYFRTMSSGLYVEHLPAWLTAFGDDARVVFAEDLEQDADTELARLLGWLDLDPAKLDPAEAPPVGPAAELDATAAPGHSSFGQAVTRWWPVLQRASGPWRGEPGDPGRRLPRQSERARHRVRSLYAGANRELAALLRDRGYGRLPDWLRDA
jgi:hypothetical protein